MTKKRRSSLQLEQPQFIFKVAEVPEKPTDNNELDTEIECPLCNMNLYYISESPYYGCGDCNFCLYI